MRHSIAFTLYIACMLGCTNSYPPGSFGSDIDFLKTHKETLILKNNNDACQIAVVPDYQGRVMTSTSQGPDGISYGWINRGLIASGQLTSHINPFGGEDRFWLGPEAGQYALFFRPGTEFTFENWQTPAPIDSEPFDVLEKSDTTVVFSKRMQLTNYAGFTLDINVNRTISLLNRNQIEKRLGMDLGDIAYVGYESDNIVTNAGTSIWTRDNGLLSIWILGMFVPSDETTVIVPYKDSLELNTKYFGRIGPDRLHVTPTAVLFKADGKYRCKIGVPPQNALPYAGSYDAERGILTIVEFTFEGDTSYVNSLWETQQDPYGGDVFNSYNDGPLENGEMLGPFYELETSSSAKALAPGESLRHVNATYHFEGSRDALNVIARKFLRTDLNAVGVFE